MSEEHDAAVHSLCDMQARGLLARAEKAEAWVLAHPTLIDGLGVKDWWERAEKAEASIKMLTELRDRADQALENETRMREKAEAALAEEKDNREKFIAAESRYTDEARRERDDLRARHLKSDSLREENWKEVLRLQAQLRHCVMDHEATTEKLESVRSKLAAAEAANGRLKRENL